MLEYGHFCLVSARLSLKRHYPFTYYFQSSFRAVLEQFQRIFRAVWIFRVIFKRNNCSKSWVKLCQSAVILVSLVRVWASRDATLSRTITIRNVLRRNHSFDTFLLNLNSNLWSMSTTSDNSIEVIQSILMTFKVFGRIAIESHQQIQ